MSNIDFKQMKKHMESLTEEDWERMREEHEKKLQRWNELAKTHKPIILSDDRFCKRDNNE